MNLSGLRSSGIVKKLILQPSADSTTATPPASQPLYRSNTTGTHNTVNNSTTNVKRQDSGLQQLVLNSRGRKSERFGQLHITLVKLSTKLFDGTIQQCRCKISLNNKYVYTQQKRSHKSNKPIVYHENFVFGIVHPTDYISIQCYRTSSTGTSNDELFGTCTISLSHLPHHTEVTKWYELKCVANNNHSNTQSQQGGAIVQLKLRIDLHDTLNNNDINNTTTTSQTNGGTMDSTATINISPSQHIRDVIRYTQSIQPSQQYKFIDYFVTIGCQSPLLGTTVNNQPIIIERYPYNDKPQFPLPDNLPLFAFPTGYELSTVYQPPHIFTFRLSNERDQTIATCLVYYELKAAQCVDVSHRNSNADDIDPVYRPDNASNNNKSTFHNNGTIHDKSMSSMQRRSSKDDTHRLSNGTAPVLSPLTTSASTPSLVTQRNNDIHWVYAPKCICFVSRLSYVNHYKQILIQLYNTFILPDLQLQQQSHEQYNNTIPEPSVQPRSITTPQTITPFGIIDMIQHTHPRVDTNGHTVEQYIQLLCDELPLPIPNGTGVEFTLDKQLYNITLPALDHDLPHTEYSIYNLFQILDVDTVLLLLRCILIERNIILHSASLSLLQHVGDCLIALLFPFNYPHVYIPIVPYKFHTVVESPVAYIVGFHTSSMNLLHTEHQLSNCTILDIDSSICSVQQPPPLFPVHAQNILIKSIRPLIRPNIYNADLLQHQHDTIGHHTDRLIRLQFMGFFASLISSYRDYLFFVDGHIPVFDTPSYLNTINDNMDLHNYNYSNSSIQSNDSLPFLCRFLETQIFREFLDKHIEYPSYLQDYTLYINKAITSDRNNVYHVELPASLSTANIQHKLSTVSCNALIDPLSHLLHQSLFTSAPRELIIPNAPNMKLYRNPSTLLSYATVRDSLYNKQINLDRRSNLNDISNNELIQSAQNNDNSTRDNSTNDTESTNVSFSKDISYSTDGMLSSPSTPINNNKNSNAMSNNATTRHTSNQSLSLISKSDYEKRKPIEQSRLYHVVEQLMSTSSSIDLGELSSVCELLSLYEWRNRLCDVYLQLYKLGLYTTEQRNVSTYSFNSISLLFNMTLDNCDSQHDYQHAHILLNIASKLYHTLIVTPTRVQRRLTNDVVHDNELAINIGSEDETTNPEREYLIYTLKRQSLWSDTQFWLYCYNTEYQNINMNSELITEILGGIIYNALSVGATSTVCHELIELIITQYTLDSDKKSVLYLLVDNLVNTLNPLLQAMNVQHSPMNQISNTEQRQQLQ